ncbi:MAG: hypothetical protein ACRENJ_05785 [Candidatus Eiseniibacteriota bacterium]
MPEYVDKLRVTVRVSRPGEPAVEGTLSLLPHSARHGGPETLLELLDPAAGFIPFERSSDDAVLLLSRPDIQWVMAGPEVDPDLIRPPAFRFTREERVWVSLRDGEVLDGLIQMELPENINRVSDYLNGPERFFPLTTRRGTFLVHKAAVRQVSLFDSSPLPLADAASGE